MKPYSTVVASIREKIAAAPDFVADDTYFVDANEGEPPAPMCIFGHVLVDHGAVECGDDEDNWVENADGLRVLNRLQATVQFIDWNALDIETPSAAERKWSEVLQSTQDGGTPWGEALEAADHYVDVHFPRS